ncbi:MAG: hypothetical protein WBP26_00075 [Candidatus Saccharimonadales bacterium]
MILKNFIALASVGFFVILAEVLRAKTHAHRELTRKVAHIGAAIAVSVWPFYLSMNNINVLALILLVGVLISMHFKLVPSIHNVRRKSHGEWMFALAIMGVAAFADSPATFCVSILFLGLADGLAAIIGTMHGKGNEYHVLGSRKSRAGTLTFFVVSVCLLICYNIWTADPLAQVSAMAIFTIALFATILENIGLKGTDNLTVPMLVVIALSTL